MYDSEPRELVRMDKMEERKLEEEERRAKKYDKYLSFARTMSKEELREAYVELMIELDESGKGVTVTEGEASKVVTVNNRWRY